MKIIAATGRDKLLVEMSTDEVLAITGWSSQDYKGHVDLYELEKKVHTPIDLRKEFDQARRLLESFRGFAPSLRKEAERLQKLASAVESHEPNPELKPSIEVTP